jgi:hypothetical protein
MALNYVIKTAMQKPGVYLHCFPKYNQGKKAIWNSVHDTDTGEAMQYLDHFPKEIVKYKNSSDMRIELINGSVYCVMGIDGKNATQARGMNPCFVILSEYAFMDPESWYTLEPRVSQNNGTAIFLSTPNGQNHFYKLYNYAKTGQDPNYFAEFLTIDDTKTLSAEHIDRLRAEGIPEDFIQQEYYCSFTRGAEGSYYGKYIQKCRDDDRICSINHSPDLPCHTAWDIGYGDSTSIWIFQELSNGRLNFIHYYENNNEGLPHYCGYLDNWRTKNSAIWGRHFAPHDMKHGEFSTGVERTTMARNLGYQMTVLPSSSVEDGIQTVRSTLPHCCFDLKSTKRGIDCLDFYRKKWNDNLKVYYDVPMHDQYSHGADAFRYACVGMKTIGGMSHSLTPDKILEMRRKNLGY